MPAEDDTSHTLGKDETVASSTSERQDAREQDSPRGAPVSEIERKLLSAAVEALDICVAGCHSPDLPLRWPVKMPAERLELLQGTFHEGDTIRVDAHGDALAFEAQKPKTP